MLLLQIKYVSEVAVLKHFRNSYLVNFISGLFSKFKLIGISIASDNGIFVNKLVTSIKTENLSVLLTDLIVSIDVKLSFVEYLDDIWGERRQPKNWERL